MEGKGIITQSCKTLINYGFNNLQLHRIEIKAATHNLKSQAIAEKLHFKKEGVLRAAELVNNVYFDLQVYSILRPEWPYKEQVTPLLD
jgi:ribosomal-protein-serine acetyltransferase